MIWFDKDISFDGLDKPVTPSMLFRVMSVSGTNAEDVKIVGYTAIGLPESNSGDSSFAFSIQDQRDAAKISHFCMDNGFLFFANVIGKPFTASQFQPLRLYDFHKIKHGFVAEIDDDRWVEIGQYNTSRMVDMQGQPMDLDTGLTYARIVLANSSVPYIRLDSKHHGARGKGSTPDQLEGDFNQTFDVHTKDGAQTDLRYVLTPDVMAILLDVYPDFDIEICDGCLFILMPHAHYWEPEIMEGVLSAVRDIYELIGTRTEKIGSTEPNSKDIEPNSYEKMIKQCRAANTN